MDRSAQEYSDVAEILAFRKPTRLAIIVRKRSSLSGKEPSIIVEDALSALDLSEAEHRFLVHEKWQRFDVLVLDIFNAEYDWETAHRCCDLPVVLVDYGQAKQRVSVAPPMRQREVNAGVASHHNLNGWHTRPPYVADHTLPFPPSYDRPRDLQYG